MGRDGMLPRSVFAHLDPKYATPIRSVWLIGVISFAGSLLIGFQQIVELVNFGAFAGFILVNLSVIGHYYFGKRERAGLHVVRNLVFPLLGAIICSAIWLNLSQSAQIAGFLWLAAGVCYLIWLTRGFSVPVKLPELP